jgi:hypothetical protein
VRRRNDDISKKDERRWKVYCPPQGMVEFWYVLSRLEQDPAVPVSNSERPPSQS